jgi:hypothetical protein
MNKTGNESMKPLRILFIGNSHTYFHHMPRILNDLAVSAGFGDMAVEQVTGEGAGLSWHWQNRETRAVLARGKWDHVVLQDRSRGPLEDRAAMFCHARLFDAEIRDLGARTVFYMTWANRRTPENQEMLAAAYMEIARELDALVAPVGLVWESVLEKHPDIRLHHTDDRHAGPAGAYLSACVFFSLLFGSSCEGLAAPIHSGPGKVTVLPEETALILQRVAFEEVMKYVEGSPA